MTSAIVLDGGPVLEPSPTSTTPPAPSISPERIATVDAARQGWIRKLIDLSRRNNLLFFRELKVGTLDLSGAPPDAMRALLQSGKTNDDGGVQSSRLVTDERVLQAAASVRGIANRARINFEERGLDTLYIALGLATWTSVGGGRPACAPVLLLPVKATPASGRSHAWALCRTGDIKVNEVLLHALDVEHGVRISGDSLIEAILGDDEGETFDLVQVFERLTREAGRVAGFEVEPRWMLGNFSFQKLAIVRDLEDLLQALAAHDIVAGIAGDQTAAELARGSRTIPDPAEIDRTAPDQEFLVRDADASQQQAIGATLAGQTGVISGPPGTGKSQTIANLIAELAARGKTVLFVAEKRAALDVVLNRLREHDLGHLCLDLHGADISRRFVAQQLQESLMRVRETAAPATGTIHQRFVERRHSLNTHVERMHTLRAPSGLSVYQMYGHLLWLPAAGGSSTRFSGAALARLDDRTIRASMDLLREASGLSSLVTGESTSFWTGAVFADADSVRLAMERARRLSQESWPKFETAFQRLLAERALEPCTAISEIRRVFDVLSAVEAFCANCRPALFRSDLYRLAKVLAPARSATGQAWALLFDADFKAADFRAARELVRSHHESGTLSARGALGVVEDALRVAERWSSIVKDGAPPLVPVSLAAARTAFAAVTDDLKPLLAVLSGRRLNEQVRTEMPQVLAGLAGDAVTPAQLLRLHKIEAELAGMGTGAVLTDIRARKPDPAVWPDLLRHAWLASCLEDVQLQDPGIAAFSGRAHSQIVSEFQTLDRERLAVAVARVKSAHAHRAIEVRNRHPEEDGLVAREAQKKTRHMPLRQLFAKAPHVMLALRPCWTASPLSVSQLMPGDKTYFDVVIFDEASQVLPEDAVTSLLRGTQAIVAGDRRQLPPTTFFAAGEDEEEADEGDATGGFESILDVMSAFLDPPWSLDWHYRSRDEALIAFSNHRIYGGRLITFPGAGMGNAIRHELVPQILGDGTQEQSAGLEVQRVVEIVVEHARTRPQESLGVIAMGIKHAQRIEMALEEARKDLPDLDEFFGSEQRERFFVKNLERVQGDERDAIILSIGYGKNEAGHLLYRFGPLLQQGGDRRLNVAITRARQRLTLVSSFSHADIDPGFDNHSVQLLRAYLEYAASGGKRLDVATLTQEPLNEFEESVCDELTRRGMKVIDQVGTSRSRIDLVAMHPQRPGRYVLAIECDGASYHSAPTARDRDRLRQQQLEALGWRFHRIWSTDWFLKRDAEIDRVMQAYEEAVRRADREDEESAVSAKPLPETPRVTPALAPAASAPPARVRLEAPTSAAPAPPLRVRAQAPKRTASAPPVSVRGEKPWEPTGQAIDRYSESQLVQMIEWVQSDGLLRTDDEIMVLVVKALGYKRRGTKIVAAVGSALERYRLP